MTPLNLPGFEYKVKMVGQRTQIFDRIRKKYIALTPEEWVRQHIVNFLSTFKNYPISLLKVEASSKYNSQQKRTDVLAYDLSGNPVLLIECKAPEIKIDAAVFEQISRYNSSIKAPYLLVSNGLDHYCCRVNFETGTWAFTEDIPDFSHFKVEPGKSYL
jgi:hypothetical protein